MVRILIIFLEIGVEIYLICLVLRLLHWAIFEFGQDNSSLLSFDALVGHFNATFVHVKLRLGTNLVSVVRQA